MICPLVNIQPLDSRRMLECEKAECAWWDRPRDKCAILSLAQRLGAIAEAVKK